MSSCPGYTLELFLAWEFSLLVDDLEDPNPSLGFAEGLGLGQTRMVVTAEQFKPIVNMFEESRSVIEDALCDYDEEKHGSWRSYGCYLLERYYPNDQEAAMIGKVKTYLDSVKRT